MGLKRANEEKKVLQAKLQNIAKGDSDNIDDKKSNNDFSKDDLDLILDDYKRFF